MNNADAASVIAIYRRRAKRYDWSSLLLYLAGFRHKAYRKRAIDSLNLQLGDTVVDLGCGTGLNFPLLHDKIGPRGRIVGVDITDAMLHAAAARVKAHNWTNIQLVASDAATYAFPSSVDAILSTFALTLVPAFDNVIRSGASALPPGRRFVILDFKMPSGRLMKSVAPFLAKVLTGPFGGTIEMASRKPWLSLQKWLTLVHFTELYLGGAYIAIGEKPGRE